jgi:hypothetical protein
MKPESIKYILLIILVFVSTSFPQSNRYTKGAENGYMWQAMSEPNLMYSVSKENYLSSILDRTQITGEKYPEIASLTCREDIEKIYKEGKSNKLSLEDVVKREFGYSDNFCVLLHHQAIRKSKFQRAEEI